MSDFEQLTAGVQRQIDELCDRFESELRAGNASSIQDYLHAIDDDVAKGILFAELLVLDLNRDSSQKMARLDELRTQFPTYLDAIDRAAREDGSISLRTKACEETIAGSDTTPAPIRSESDNDGKLEIAQYELIEVVGAGAFGQVWKARDTKLDRVVAIKIPRTENLSAAEAERFLKEARVAAKLNHPNIVAVHEIGKANQTPYIVTDFIHGATIDEWRKQQDRSHADATRLCIQIAVALHQAHETGIVHRDLKPSNVIVDQKDEPHVADFGLAKALADETMTTAGNLLGSPAYMSPEQATGDAYKADRRSDIYSLGVILYELLVGERPFRGSADAVIHQVIYNEPVAPRTIDPKVPKDLETIGLKCLSKDPAQRYQSARLLADDLRRFERGEPILARPVSGTEQVWTWCKRNPAFATALGVALGLLTFLAIAGPWVAGQNAKQIRAQQERLYVTDLVVAQKALESANTPRAIDVLQKYADDPDLRQLRCFDWYHLWHRANKPGVASRQHGPTNGLNAMFSMSHDRQFVALDNSGVEIINTNDLSVSQKLPDVGGSCSFHPTEPWLLCQKDGVAVVWDIQNDKLVKELPQVKTGSMKYSHDGKYIAGLPGYLVNEIVVWDVENERLYSFVEEECDYQSVYFSPTKNRLVVTGSFKENKETTNTGMLTVIDLNEDGDHKKQVVPINTRWTRSIAFTDDGTTLAPVDHRKTKLLDAETLEVKASKEWSAVDRAAFSPDGKLLACGNWSGSVIVYRCSDDYRVMEQVTQIMSITAKPSIGFNRIGKLLTKETTGRIVIWDYDNARCESTITRHESGALRAKISPDNKTVVSSGETGTVVIANLQTGDQLKELQTTRRTMTGTRSFPDISLSPAGDTVAVANREAIDFYDVSTGRKTKTLNSGATGLCSITFSPTSDKIAMWDAKGVVQQCSLAGRNRIRMQVPNAPGRNFAQSIEYSSDGRFLAVPSGKQAFLLNASTLKVAHQLGEHGGGVSCLDFSPDSRRIVTGCADGIMRMWNTSTGKLIHEFPTHGSHVRALAWSPDGKTIASSSEGQVKLWNVRTLEETITLIDFLPVVLDLEFSRDGENLVAAAFAFEVKVWRAPQN